LKQSLEENVSLAQTNSEVSSEEYSFSICSKALSAKLACLSIRKALQGHNLKEI
jgi:hypothetical protein